MPGWRPALVALAVALGVLAPRRAEAGHELSFYPSFYPQEIRLSVVDPAAAARLLRKKSLHAYLGPDPFAGMAAPAHVAYAPSFGSYLVLTFVRAEGPFADAATRCAAAGRVAHDLARPPEGLIAHPYPVTPYHDDYLQHFDLVERARKALEQRVPGSAPALRAEGRLAETLRRAGLRVGGAVADAIVEEVPLDHLLAPEIARLDGWVTPPWLKEGWFHAYLLLGGTVTDRETRRQIQLTLQRRVSGATVGTLDRVNTERLLVSLLTRGCERFALGYTLRRQAYNTDYSNGVENVGYDAQAGLGSAVFFRTVKLKDFPWNGWLRVGVQAKPLSAWNPLAGFTDETGQVLWSIVGDPAFLAAPRSGGWVANRVQPLAVDTPTEVIEVPADALRPDIATGTLRPVGPGTTARTRIVYHARCSTFHDGTKMSPADLLYPFVFAWRWSAKDPAIARATASLRERLVGVKVVTVDTEIRVLDDVQVIYDLPRIEVYLAPAADAADAAAVAPPWSAVPWQLTALMEEAAARGLAAVSEAEARRRGVAWLDLVRDRKLQGALVRLLESFERRAWVPEALTGLVTADQARRRWAALRRFASGRGHLLVTNGPYQLGHWSARGVVLPVFRDFSYPLGVGTYDRFAVPLQAFMVKGEQRGGRIEIEAEIEAIVRSGRSYRIVRSPFRHEPAGESVSDAVPMGHYAVVGPGDEVVALGASQELDGHTLVIDLRGRLEPGAYRVAVALTVGGNRVDRPVQVIPYHVAD